MSQHNDVVQCTHMYTDRSMNSVNKLGQALRYVIIDKPHAEQKCIIILLRLELAHSHTMKVI